MRKFLSRFPLHTFLFIFFISFFLFAQNPAHVTFQMMPRTLFYGSVFSVVLFFIFYLFLRNKLKAGIITTLLLLILFNYGVMYDIIEFFYYKDLWPFKNIHRYLLVFTFLLCGFSIYIILKKIKTGETINYFLNALFIILIIFNSFRILSRQINTTPNESLLKEIALKTDSKNLPNIYYIILDGYANQHILKEYYNFDNSDFINFLSSQGFSVADSARSNYYSTVPSLCSTFNLNYLSGPADDRIENLRDNAMFRILKANGYTIYTLKSGYSVTSGFKLKDSTITINTPNEFERSILKFTIFRLDDLFGVIQYRRLKSQFEKLPELASLSTQKRFVFVHIVAPHPPFVFDQNGNQLFNNKNHDNYWEPRQNYINQLIYVNKQIKDYISQIINHDKSAAIILQSDHGPWIQSQNDSSVFEARSMILDALRFPNGNNLKAPRSISSVNTFRFFLKNYFDSTYKLLPDISAGKTEVMKSIMFKERKRN